MSVSKEVLADLAAAARILAAQGVVDGFGHVSLRHPTDPNRYLMARSIAPALVTPDDTIQYDLDSNPLDAVRKRIAAHQVAHLAGVGREPGQRIA